MVGTRIICKEEPHGHEICNQTKGFYVTVQESWTERPSGRLYESSWASSSQEEAGRALDVDEEELGGMLEFASLVRNNHNWPLTWTQYRSDAKVSSSIILASVASAAAAPTASSVWN